MVFRIEERSAPTARTGIYSSELRLTCDRRDGLSGVDRVVYTLHPALKGPVRVASDAAAQFSIKFETWGTFKARARVVMKDGSDQQIWRDLSLSPPNFSKAPPNASAAEIFALGQRFMDVDAFSYARRIFDAALRDRPIDAALKQKITHQLALATYKDAGSPAPERYEHALAILEDLVHWATGADQADAYGMIGAVHKRRWELDGQLIHLDRALQAYEAGLNLAEAGQHRRELVYNAVNLAYIQDLLADLEEKNASQVGTVPPSEAAQARRNRALEVRHHLIELFSEDAEKYSSDQTFADSKERDWAWWLVATLIEAHAGRKEYPQAIRWATLAKDWDVPDWKRETAARQIANLIRVVEKIAQPTEMKTTEGWRLLSVLLAGDDDAVYRSIIGKVGLALSGGGFRASLYHIGVLARLAEMDVLRHIEVISCVSGGSIIGAHYYLELRRLLETRMDNEITQNDYIAMVQRVAGKFLAGVQTNIRTRVIGDPIATLRMLITPESYSRTEKLGELYDRELFAQADPASGKDPKLNDLFIFPPSKVVDGKPVPDQAFSIRSHNWRRRNKVPILVLNATTLNTGHTWQFTASWMGEPPEGVDAQVGMNGRLRRMYFGEAPDRYRTFPLGNAVAASSCVPGMFDPITLPELFEGEQTVRLVDGGVHDNQGVGSLLEQECAVMLVSDASGQMGSDADPSGSALGVALRANNILQARVREAEYRELEVRRRSGLLRGLMFIHLKMGLSAPDRNWIGYEDDLKWTDPPPAPDSPLTAYGIRKDMQEKLSAVRTDLDSFSDIEAFSLMTSGYRMTEWQFPRTIRWPYAVSQREPWAFLAAEDGIGGEATEVEALKYGRHLQVASQLAFRVWQLHPVLRVLRWVIAGLALVAVLIGLDMIWHLRLLVDTTVGVLVSTAASIALIAGLSYAASLFFGPWAGRAVNWRATIRRWLIGTVLATAGALIAWAHLLLFDRMFVRLGRIDRSRARAARPLPSVDAAGPAGDVH